VEGRPLQLPILVRESREKGIEEEETAEDTSKREERAEVCIMSETK